MNWLSKREETILSLTNKIGQLIIVTAMFLVSCIPIITIGTAITSIYYAVVKVIRRERGYLYKEYISAFRRNFKNGCIFTVGIMIWGLLLYFNREYVNYNNMVARNTLKIIYNSLIVVTFSVLFYLFPNLSRFKMKRVDLLKLSMFMAIRQLPSTILLMFGCIVMIFLLWHLPILVTLLLPGIWCYLSSFVMERVLKLYMKQEKKENINETWNVISKEGFKPNNDNNLNYEKVEKEEKQINKEKIMKDESVVKEEKEINVEAWYYL